MKKVLQNHFLPSVEITVNKNQIKVYDDEKVYLEEGTEFELYFNNPTWNNYKAEIFINGKKQKSALVLGPKESFHLDRFMDEKRKMKVDVFEVDDVQETKKQRKNNGSIKVKFYKEIPQNITWTTYNGTGSISQPWNNTTITCDGYYTNTTTSNAVFTSNVSGVQMSGTRSMSKSISSDAPKVETARVESGKKSKQDFKTVHMNFEINPEIEFEYKILPASQEPEEEEVIVRPKDIRNYCPDCGRRVKKNWVYCAGCGTKV